MTRLWLTVAEASEATGMSQTTIRRGVAAGTIPVLRSLGDRGSIRVSRRWAEDGDDTQGVGLGVPVHDSERPARRTRKAPGWDRGARDVDTDDDGGTGQAEDEAEGSAVRYTFDGPGVRRRVSGPVAP